MAAVTLKDVLHHGLGEIYDAERQLLPLLDRLEPATQQERVRLGLRGQREATTGQIENLHRCFELLGTGAPRVECTVVRGVAADNRRFHELGPAPWAAEVYDLESVAKAVQFTVASYDGLARIAQALDQDDVRRLLEQNLARARESAGWIDDARSDVLARFRARRPVAAGESSS